MALDWLSGAIDLAQVGLGAYDLFSGNSDVDTGDFDDVLDLNRKITKALIDPTRDPYASLATQEEDRIRGDLAAALQQWLTADRRAAARGVGTINPERRDEAVASAFASMNQQAREQARANARAFLTAAAGINMGGMNGAGANLIGQQQNIENRAMGIEGLFDARRNLLNGGQNLFGGSNLTVAVQPGQRRTLPTISGMPGYSYYGGPR